MGLANSGQAKCPSDGVIPLEQGTSPHSDPVWARLEVSEDALDNPVLNGTIFWNCTSSSLDSCAGLCEINVTDNEAPGSLKDTLGRGGFSVHHGQSFFDFFRAGSFPDN
jgi:hypothetical protein